MRNLTIPEACLVVGTAVLGGAVFLSLESARFAQHHAVHAPVEVAPAPAPAPAALTPPGTLPSSAPLAPPPPSATIVKEERPGTKAHGGREKLPVPGLDGACERSDDPLCGAL